MSTTKDMKHFLVPFTVIFAQLWLVIFYYVVRLCMCCLLQAGGTSVQCFGEDIQQRVSASQGGLPQKTTHWQGTQWSLSG